MSLNEVNKGVNIYLFTSQMLPSLQPLHCPPNESVKAGREAGVSRCGTPAPPSSVFPVVQVELRTGHQWGLAEQDRVLVYSLASCSEQCGLLAGPSILVETFSEIYRPVPAGCGLWEGKKCPF